MRYTPTMQQVIEAIAQKHGLDLAQPGASLRLERGAALMPLVIEVLLPGMISVAHYRQQHGDMIADPDVEFCLFDAGWAPAAITQPLTGYASCVEDEPAQHDLADFCELWARNIRDQGWLDRGMRAGGDAAPVAA